MAVTKLIMGWDAPKVSDQFPEMDDEQADRFDKDIANLAWLSLRGIVTRSERNKASDRIGKKVSKELSRYTSGALTEKT